MFKGRSDQQCVCADSCPGTNLGVFYCSCCRCWDIGTLQDCLYNHGQHLHTLRLHSIKGLSALPCPQLQHLTLCSCEFNLKNSSTFWHSISTLTALSSLHINKCELLVERFVWSKEEPRMAHLLAVLAPLTGLQELSMCGVMATSQVHGNHKDSLLVMLHTSILQRMQHLTQLHLSTDYGPGTELLQHVGSMTDLRDLRVGGSIQRG